MIRGDSGSRNLSKLSGHLKKRRVRIGEHNFEMLKYHEILLNRRSFLASEHLWFPMNRQRQ